MSSITMIKLIQDQLTQTEISITQKQEMIDEITAQITEDQIYLAQLKSNLDLWKNNLLVTGN